MNKLRKQKELVQLKEDLEKTQLMVFVDFRGVPVNDMVQLRSTLKKEGVLFKVIKNNIFLLAVKESKWEELVGDVLVGPTAVGFRFDDDPVELAKIIVGYLEKKQNPLSFKKAFLKDKEINIEEFKNISKLPTKEVLIAQMLFSMKSPISGLVGVTGGIIRKFMYALQAIKDKKSN